jgi:thioredoxin 1
MSELHLSSDDFQKKVNESDLPVMIDFYADWCGPCKMMAPSVEALGKEYKGKANIYKFNVDEGRDIAMKYGISSIPSVLFFKRGEVVDQFVGALPKEKIEDYLKRHL